MTFVTNTGGRAAPPATNIAARLGAIILVVLGLLFVATSVLGFLPEDQRMTTAGLIFLMVLGLVVGGIGMSWLRSQRVRETTDLQLHEERTVLGALERADAGLTLPDLARGTELLPDHLETVLGRLTHQRMVEPDLTEEGKVVYRVRKE